MKTFNQNPSAWVVSSIDKGRKSIKSGKVYLKDKEEFEIELFNPLQVSVLADIKLNGSSISENGLVIKPGQRVYLDCFIEDRKKFIFNTYEVENSNEVINAIAQNGFLEVNFYKEERIVLRKNFSRSKNTFFPNQSGLGNMYSSTSYSIDSSYSNLKGSLTTTNLSNTIETGTVEKGGNSNQQFTYVNMNFEKYVVSTTILQLLPESRKPIEAKDLKKFKEESISIIDMIAKLGDLYSNGLLTDEEFSKKKSELLSKI